jgi:chromosome segregation ATPase
LNTQSKMKGQPFHSSSDQLGQVNKTGRLLSAQRIKNNDLQNRISELNIEIEKLREENRTIKRMHKREEVALKKLETQDTDVTKVVKGYQDEINSLKQKIRKIQSENRAINNSLLDREDEVRVLKKKNSELKEILDDKNLIESSELSKKLEASEYELKEQRTKYQVIDKDNFFKDNPLKSFSN